MAASRSAGSAGRVVAWVDERRPRRRQRGCYGRRRLLQTGSAAKRLAAGAAHSRTDVVKSGCTSAPRGSHRTLNCFPNLCEGRQPTWQHSRHDDGRMHHNHSPSFLTIRSSQPLIP